MGWCRSSRKRTLTKRPRAIQQKETALLNGRSVAQLPTDVLPAIFRSRSHRVAPHEPQRRIDYPDLQALSWLVETLLPTLVSVAKVIIPILV